MGCILIENEVALLPKLQTDNKKKPNENEVALPKLQTDNKQKPPLSGNTVNKKKNHEPASQNKKESQIPQNIEKNGKHESQTSQKVEEKEKHKSQKSFMNDKFLHYEMPKNSNSSKKIQDIFDEPCEIIRPTQIIKKIQKNLKSQPEIDLPNLLNEDGDIYQKIKESFQINYYHIKINELLQKMRLQNLSGQQSYFTEDRAQYATYNRCLNLSWKSNNRGSKQILKILNDYAKTSDKHKLDQRMKDESKYLALKSFIFLFTAQCHQSINQSLKKNAYDKLILVIAAVLKELHQYNSEYENILKFSSQNQNQKFTLFRGINCYDKSMKPGKNLFWKGFTSTSKNLSVAETFGDNIYCVNIKNNSHPYIVVPQNLSAYKGEEEVILFPYFSFKVMSVKEEKHQVFYMLESNIFND